MRTDGTAGGGGGPGGPAPGPGSAGDTGSVLAWVLERSHDASAEDLSELVEEAARRLDLGAARLYLADVQQAHLIALPHSPASRPQTRDAAGDRVLDVEGSLAGLAYRTESVQRARDTGTLWIPMIDGVERVGVMRASPAPGTDPLAAAGALASLATLLVVSKSPHNELLTTAQRTRPMSLQAELLWAFLPPRTIGTRQATSSAVLEPAYDIGGDAFDHTFTDGLLHLTMLDAMGHDLASGGASATALAGCRSTRRTGGSLSDIVTTIDRTLEEWVPGRLLTAVFANLDTHDGEFTWINCGHPPPLLIRDGHVLPAALERSAQPPLGFGFHTPPHPPPAQHRVRLQPGDRVLFYSDGVTEARSAGGELFGEARLADTVIRSMASGVNAPEALRRLIQNLLTHQDQRLNDDATILLAEWHPEH
ncbi:PP2C family protein-serine/threonine phosphatase [Streptomyces sp. NPDC012888]|uniref:PP2C family protein-serine/threonine phosphatase n=1 Tax=Streptomyces sp. NPDC012888 TaxID=3364855 RepID=UPI0036AA2833